MRIFAIAFALGFAACSATVTASAPVSATVPLTEREHAEQHEEHPSRACVSSVDCDPSLRCCFSAPGGATLTEGYCATVEMCEAVASPPR